MHKRALIELLNETKKQLAKLGYELPYDGTSQRQQHYIEEVEFAIMDAFNKEIGRAHV